MYADRRSARYAHDSRPKPDVGQAVHVRIFPVSNAISIWQINEVVPG